MKFKKLLSIILASIMSLGMCSVAFAADEIPEGYTAIYTAEDLNNIRNDLSGKYILKNHIDLSEYSDWKPVGKYGSPFTGEIDGNGYLIINLNSSESLLGRTESAVIKNLGIVDCNIVQSEEIASYSSAAGAFAEDAIDSVFENCFVTGHIKPFVRDGMAALIASCKSGGMVSVSKNSTFKNCYNNADIELTYNSVSLAKIGGLVGDAYNTTFTCCYSTGPITYKDIDNLEDESTNVDCGVLAGEIDESTSFTFCYFGSNLINAVGSDSLTPTGTKNLSDSEMKEQASYEGFDFENVWEMTPGSYPKLQTEKSIIIKDISANYKDKLEIIQYGDTQIVEWKTTDKSIAVVADGNIISCVGVGSAVITVTTSDNQTEEISVNVSYTFWQKIIIYLFFGWLWY